MPRDTWQPNGAVTSSVFSSDGTRLYVGGEFDYLGPTTGASIRVDDAGKRTGLWPRFEGGAVNSIVAAPGGGWYVGGSFTKVDGIARSSLVKVRSDGTLDPTWTSPITAQVYVLEVVGSQLAVGTNVTSSGAGFRLLDASGADVPGFTRPMTVTTGGSNGGVLDIAYDDDWFYVGGKFDTYDGTMRASLARISRIDGSIDTGWIVGGVTSGGAAGRYVMNLELDAASNRLFVQGNFEEIDGQARWKLGAIDLNLAVVDPWQATSYSSVTTGVNSRSMLVHGGHIYVSGTNAMGAGNYCSYARHDLTTGNVDPSWCGLESKQFAQVNAAAIDGGDIVIGGKLGGYTKAGGWNAVRVSLSDSSVSDGVATTGKDVNTLVQDGSDWIVGGGFMVAEGVERDRRVAAIDLASGEADPWRPSGTFQRFDVPNALVLDGEKLYVGGTRGHTSLVGPGLWWYSTTTGAASDLASTIGFGANTGDRVNALAHDGTGVIVGGAFSGSKPAVFRIAPNGAVDTGYTPGLPTDLDVRDLAVSPLGTYAAGGNSAGPMILRLDASGNVDGTWGVSITGTTTDRVEHVTTDGATVWIEGTFTMVGTTSVAGFAAITSSASVIPWMPGYPSSSVEDIHAFEGNVLLTGSYANKASLHSGSSGGSLGWTPTWAPASGRTIATHGSRVAISGEASIALFTNSSDTRPPMVDGVQVVESAPGDRTDATYAPTATTVYVRTMGSGPSPTFSVKARAWDTWSTTNPTVDHVSGIDRVTLGDAPASLGTWSTVGKVQPGSARGLKLACFKSGSDMNAANAIGTTVDPSIAYSNGSTGRIDQYPSRPASLALSNGLAYDDATDSLQSFKLLSCRWSGHLVAPSDASTSTLQAWGDNGFRLKVGTDSETVPATWNVIDEWLTLAGASLPGSVSLAPGQVRPLVAEWWENDGIAFADLRWNAGGSLQTIPEVAYVTNTTYTREYRLHSHDGVITAGSTIPVDAADAAGNPAAQRSFQLYVDNRAPDPPSTFTVAPTIGSISAATTASIDVGFYLDSGAGIDEVRLERRSTGLAGGSCADPGSDEVGWTTVSTPASNTTVSEPALAAGCYQYRLHMWDKVGNETIALPAGVIDYTQWLRIDPSAPDTATASFGYAGGWTNAATTTLSVAAPSDPESGIASTRIEQKTATLDGGLCSGWSTSWTTTLTSPAASQSVALTDDSCYQFRLVAVNGAGTEAAMGPGPELKVDQTAPGISFDPGIDGSTQGPGSATFGGPLTDASAANANLTLVVSLTGPSGPLTGCSPTVTATTWSCTGTTTGLPSGSYTMSITATDPAGNAAAASVSITIDNDPPLLAPTIGAATGVYTDAGTTTWIRTAAAGSVPVDVNPYDASGMSSVTPSAATSGFSLTTPSSPAWQSTLAWSANATTPTPALSFTGYDVLGNFTDVTLDVQVDNAAPTGAALTLAASSGSTPALTLTPASDAQAGVASYELLRRINNAADCSGTWNPYIPIGTWTSAPSTYDDNSVLGGSCYEYELRVTDRVGNLAAHSSGTFTTDPKGIVVAPPAAGSALSEGTSTQVAVRLRALPSGGSVVLDVVGDPQVSASPSQLTFTAGDWMVDQYVTVSSAADARDEADAAAAVTFTVNSSTDAEYAALGAVAQTLTVVDDDVPALVSTAPATGLAVAEPGTSATYSLALASEPHGSVTIAASGGGGQASISPTSVSFDASNWSTPRTITVTAIDDFDIEPVFASTITHTVSATTAADSGYAALAPSSTPLTVTSDDAAGVLVAAPAAPVVIEGDAASVFQVGVRLRSRPASDVAVAIAPANTQLVVEPATITFTASNWSTSQAVKVSAVDDTLAEPLTHGGLLRITPSSAAAAWSTLPAQELPVTVRDNDAAKLTATPGLRWEVNADNHLLLDETATQGAILRITAAGDPMRDVKITPQSAAEGQLDVQPDSVVIPAGSHEQVVSFSVRALNDRKDEADLHAAQVAWQVTSADARYAEAKLPTTFARIKDAPQTLRETTSTNDTTTGGDTTGGDSTGSNTSGGDQTGTTSPPPSDPPPAQPTEDPTDGAPTETDPAPADPPPGELAGDDSGTDAAATTTADESKQQDEPKGILRKPMHDMKEWASENKGKAAMAASATGTAALWAAKPLALAGKAMAAGGGGMPHPPGLTQLRHLFTKRGRRILRMSRRKRWWRGKLRDVEEDEDDDWHDFLWNDRAA